MTNINIESEHVKAMRKKTISGILCFVSFDKIWFFEFKFEPEINQYFCNRKNLMKQN